MVNFGSKLFNILLVDRSCFYLGYSFDFDLDFLSLNTIMTKTLWTLKLTIVQKNTEENEEEMLSGDGLHEDNQRSRTSFEVIARRFLSPTQWAKISNLLKFSQFILNSY